jgi:alpha-mannosidase
MAGEFLTVGKLFKRGYQASITLGNAKAVDVLVYNPETNKSFNVQVKTLRQKNCFPIRKESIIRDHIYIFIILNKWGQEEDFYIIPGYEISDDIDRFFGASYRDPKKPSNMPAINYGPLAIYKDNWQAFDK